MMSVFLDTNYLLALFNQKDKNHQKALEVSKMIKNGEYGTSFISTYIFDELTTLALKRQNHFAAVRVGQSLMDSDILMLEIPQEMFISSWNLFKERKKLSFTDCTIVKIMQENNIKNLATFDKEFLQFMEITVLM